MQFTREAQELAKQVYEAIPVIAGKAGKKWEWEPEVGEWCIWEGVANVICQVWESYGLSSRNISIADMNNHVREVTTKRLIPLLHWEKMERIMYQLGFTMENPTFLSVWKTHFSDQSGTEYREEYGKYRQTSVMKAILAVAESLRR